MTKKGFGITAFAISLGVVSFVLTSALIGSQDPDSAEFWIDHVDSDDLQERKTAIFIMATEYSEKGDVEEVSLSASERTDVADILMSALSDPNSDVRFCAVSALRHNLKAIPDIRKLKDDPDPAVRKLVQDVLSETEKHSL